MIFSGAFYSFKTKSPILYYYFIWLYFICKFYEIERWKKLFILQLILFWELRSNKTINDSTLFGQFFNDSWNPWSQPQNDIRRYLYTSKSRYFSLQGQQFFFSWNHHFAWANSFENILINMCTTKQSILILLRLRDLDTLCYFFVIINHKWKKNLVSNNSFDLLNSISIIITSMEKKPQKRNEFATTYN